MLGALNQYSDYIIKYKTIKNSVYEELLKITEKDNANAVLGIQLETVQISQTKSSSIIFNMTGTAVVVEPINDDFQHQNKPSDLYESARPDALYSSENADESINDAKNVNVNPDDESSVISYLEQYNKAKEMKDSLENIKDKISEETYYAVNDILEHKIIVEKMYGVNKKSTMNSIKAIFQVNEVES